MERLIRQDGLPPDLARRPLAAAPPAKAAAGDIVIDAALVHGAAGRSSRTPIDVADAIARDLATDPWSAGVAVAGPGFVNVTLRPVAVLEVVAWMLRRGSASVAGGDVAGRPASDLGSAASLDHARAIVSAEQRSALSAAAEQPVSRHRARDASLRRPGAVAVGCSKPALAYGGEVLIGHGADAFRFAVASRRPDAPLRLDETALWDRSRQNPGFWVPYTHARLRGVLRQAATALPKLDLAAPALAGADLSVLTHPGEAALAMRVARHAHVVSAAASRSDPGRLAAYLVDFADALQSHWERSKDQPQLRFVNQGERALTKARLGLVTASTLVLKSGLGILGVSAPDEMS